MFRLTKVAPPHGWNAVVWELAIVTLGVLIALGAQQLVDGIHQRNEVTQLVGALRSELADSRSRWQHVRNSDGSVARAAFDRAFRPAPGSPLMQASPMILMLSFLFITLV